MHGPGKAWHAVSVLFNVLAAVQLAQGGRQCATPYVDATATYAAQPVAPPNVRVDRMTFAELAVVIGPSGSLQNVRVMRSSGNSALDAAALDAARRSRFSPKVVNCAPVTGQYLFRITFAPDAAGAAPNASTSPPSSTAPAQQPPTPQYVRMCSPYQNMTDAQFAGAKAALEARNKAALQRLATKGLRMSTPLSDAQVLAAVKAHRPGARVVRILVKNFNMFGAVAGWSGPDQPKSDAVQIEDGNGAPNLDLAVFSPDRQFLRLQPISSSALERPYGFARWMAAYMLLNDVLANDNPVPRIGCVRAFENQIDMPGVLPEIDAAMLQPPAADRRAESAVLKAYHDFISLQQPSTAPTGETIRALGKAPSASFIYRDRFAMRKGDEEIDVVKLSNGAARTYVMLGIDQAGKASIFRPPALCLVGDQRCAQYYMWP